jgi:hypothetical protein
MGVLCDVYDPSGWDSVDNSYKGHDFFPPPDISDILGLRDEVPSVNSKLFESVQSNLSALNDELVIDFDRIADYIESGYKTVYYEDGVTTFVSKEDLND